MNRLAIGVVALAGALLAACDSTPPHRYGALQNRIIEGDDQAFVAGQGTSNTAVNLTYRAQIAAAPSLPRRALDLFLPRVAYAADTTVNIMVIPGAVACVSEDQANLIPLSRCVTADQQGQSSYRFQNLPTTAGEYCAHIYSTYGTETTALAPVCITINAGSVDLDRVWANTWGCGQGVRGGTNAVADAYDNRIPFRLVGDGRVMPASDTLDSAFPDCRAALIDTTADGRARWHGPLTTLDTLDTPVARAYYAIRRYEGTVIVQWFAFGMNVTPDLCADVTCP